MRKTEQGNLKKERKRFMASVLAVITAVSIFLPSAGLLAPMKVLADTPTPTAGTVTVTETSTPTNVVSANAKTTTTGWSAENSVEFTVAGANYKIKNVNDSNAAKPAANEFDAATFTKGSLSEGENKVYYYVYDGTNVDTKANTFTAGYDAVDPKITVNTPDGITVDGKTDDAVENIYYRANTATLTYKFEDLDSAGKTDKASGIKEKTYKVTKNGDAVASGTYSESGIKLEGAGKYVVTVTAEDHAGRTATKDVTVYIFADPGLKLEINPAKATDGKFTYSGNVLTFGKKTDNATADILFSYTNTAANAEDVTIANVSYKKSGENTYTSGKLPKDAGTYTIRVTAETGVESSGHYNLQIKNQELYPVTIAQKELTSTDDFAQRTDNVSATPADDGVRYTTSAVQLKAAYSKNNADTEIPKEQISYQKAGSDKSYSNGIPGAPDEKKEIGSYTVWANLTSADLNPNYKPGKYQIGDAIVIKGGSLSSENTVLTIKDAKGTELTATTAVEYGDVLTVEATKFPDGGVPAYQWYRGTGDTYSAGAYTAIADATNSTYTVTKNDIGKQLIVKVTDSATVHEGSVDTIATKAVQKRTLTITDIKIANKSYDGTSKAEISTITVTGAAAGETVTVKDTDTNAANFRNAGDTAVDVNVGTNKPVALTCGNLEISVDDADATDRYQVALPTEETTLAKIKQKLKANITKVTDSKEYALAVKASSVKNGGGNKFSIDVRDLTDSSDSTILAGKIKANLSDTTFTSDNLKYTSGETAATYLEGTPTYNNSNHTINLTFRTGNTVADMKGTESFDISFTLSENKNNYELNGTITVIVTDRDIADLTITNTTPTYGTKATTKITAKNGSNDITNLINIDVAYLDGDGEDVTAAANAGTLDAGTYRVVASVDTDSYYGKTEASYQVGKGSLSAADFKLDMTTAVAGGTAPKAVFAGAEKGLSLGEGTKSRVELTYVPAADDTEDPVAFNKIKVTEKTSYKAYLSIADVNNYNDLAKFSLGSVEVSPMSNVASVASLDAVTVKNGVSREEILSKLPTEATLVMEDSSLKDVKAVITWDENFTYNEANKWSQKVTVDGTLFNENVNWGVGGTAVSKKIRITVNVEANIPVVKGVTTPKTIDVANGTTKEAIKAKLPAKVLLTMAEGVEGSYETTVTWSDFTYDAARADAQTLTIKGTAAKSNDMVWADDVSTEVKITVNVAAWQEPKQENPGPDDSGQNDSGQNDSGQNDSGQNNSGQNNSGQNNSGQQSAQEPVNDNIAEINTDTGMATVKDVVAGTNVEVPLAVVVEGAVFRMYNPNTGEHFYTKSSAERDSLQNEGWNYEENACFAAIAANEEGAEPVYRVYNPNSGMHHYTMSYEEAIILDGIGWNYEGISFYAYSKDSGKGSPQYRLYNPNPAGNGEHHWTVDSNERDSLHDLGWDDEGIAWNVK